MAAQLTLSAQDVITIIDNEPRTTSLKVAEVFGKLHKNILQRIESLDCSPEFTSANFSAHVENQQVGTTRRDMKYYEMTKDGFMFLVMGFTGAKAAAIKEAYINAFNWMAARLQPKPVAANVPALLREAGGPLLFQGVPVMGMAQISEFFGCDRGVIKSNVEHFPDRFLVGVHFFKISGDMLHQIALDNLHTGHIGRRHGKEWLIWSYEGVREHALCLPGRYSEAWQVRWDRYATGEPAQELVPVLEVVKPVNDTAFQSAINGLEVGMSFLQDSVKVAASVIERLVISTDPDAAGLCRMLYERCDEMHNLLDCIREDAKNARTA